MPRYVAFRRLMLSCRPRRSCRCDAIIFFARYARRNTVRSPPLSAIATTACPFRCCCQATAARRVHALPARHFIRPPVLRRQRICALPLMLLQSSLSDGYAVPVSRLHAAATNRQLLRHGDASLMSAAITARRPLRASEGRFAAAPDSSCQRFSLSGFDSEVSYMPASLSEQVIGIDFLSARHDAIIYFLDIFAG